MSKKKIWALPIAMVALLMLAAVVFAQTANAPPTVGKQIEDQMVTVGELNTSTDAVATIALADVDGAPDDTDTGADDVDDDAAFRDRIDSDTPPDGDDADDVLAFTALTYDKAVATVGLDGGTADTAVVGVWWDALDGDNTDCTPKANALGFTAGVGGNAPATSAGGTDATGFCQEFSALGTENIEAADAATGGALVSNAFHWDMLTGPEMVAAAKSDGVANYSSYGKPFKSLDVSQRNAVNGFFTNGVLAKGLIGNLTLTNQGIDGAAPHGKAGTAKIAVKASDAAGRFLGNSVGQSFMVTAKLTSTGELTAFNNPGAAPGDALTTLMSPEGSGNGITHYSLNNNDNMQIDNDGATGDDTVLTQVRMVPTEKNVLDIAVNTGTGLAPYVQRLDYSLVNGDSLPFQVGVKGDGISASGGNGEARITVKPGHTLQGGMTYNFKLVVSESGNEAMHTVSTDIRVVTVVVNEGPMFNTAMLDAMLKNADGSPKMVVRERTSGPATRTDLDADWLPMEFDFAPYVKSSGNRAMTFSFVGEDMVGMKQDADNPTKLVNDLMAAVTYRSPYKADGTMMDTNPNLKMVTITANDGAEMASYKFPVLIESNEPMLKADADINTMVDGAMVFNRLADSTTTPPTPAKKFVNLTVGERKTDEKGVETCTGCVRDDRLAQAVFALDDLFKSSADAKDEWSYSIDPEDARDTALSIDGNMLILRFVPDNDPDNDNGRTDNMLSYPDVQVHVMDKMGNTVVDTTVNLNVTIHIHTIEATRGLARGIVAENAINGSAIALTDKDGASIVDLSKVISAGTGGEYSILTSDDVKDLFTLGVESDDESPSAVYFRDDRSATCTDEQVTAEDCRKLDAVHPLDVDAAGAKTGYLLTVKVVNADDIDLGEITVSITINEVNEIPEFVTTDTDVWVNENAQAGDPVFTARVQEGVPSVPYEIKAMDAEGDTVVYAIKSAGDCVSDKACPFEFVKNTGKLVVKAGSKFNYDAGLDMKRVYDIVITASDGSLTAELPVKVNVDNANENPEFTAPKGEAARVTIDENRAYSAGSIISFTAMDIDGNDLTFDLREGVSKRLFEISTPTKDSQGKWTGNLYVNRDIDPEVELNYDSPNYSRDSGIRVHIEVNDNNGGLNSLAIDVFLSNLNDNAPEFTDKPPRTMLNVTENTARGHILANYAATDEDRDTVSYSVSGRDAASFMITDTGDLMTLASLDADSLAGCTNSQVSCEIEVVASDGGSEADSGAPVGRDNPTGTKRSGLITITILDAPDSVSTLHVSKANPVPGTEMGMPNTALANSKMTYSGMTNNGKATVMESPPVVPANGNIDNDPEIEHSMPVNFVETEWANWGTVLLIEITSESPDPNCDGGNRCVIVGVTSDSADTEIKLKAYRSGTKEERFVAALMLVENTGSGSGTPDPDSGTDGFQPVYTHTDNGVARLVVDEEDEIEIAFGSLRATVEVENEMPEIDNFTPSHESAFKDDDVDYTFTATDDQSGLPEPEDLPDNDGDDAYTPVSALISYQQCTVRPGHAMSVVDGKINYYRAHAFANESLYCPASHAPNLRSEFKLSENLTGFGFAPIRDDKDFDEIDNGYDVETTLVMRQNHDEVYYVTFIVCDKAGNCAYYDPDSNDHAEELAEVTVDETDPIFVEARTGVAWDSTDNEYDDDRSYIQVIFKDLTDINHNTVEADDFVVEGHSIKDVHVYETPDDDDWGDSSRFEDGGANTLGDRADNNIYRDIHNTVFIELEDDLLADETPDVTLVPNGIEDAAGNEQDDGDHEADDWIAPSFTVVALESSVETEQERASREAGERQELAGEDEEVVIRVTSDERLDSTRPVISVTYVNADSVDTKGTAACTKADGTAGKRDRGEIVNNATCMDSGAASGGTLNTVVEKVTNTEWIITVDEPDDTGYYNFYIEGRDRSPQENKGDEGVDPDDIVSDFFDADGDVNFDDAHFFEGDVNLAKPNVRVSGEPVRGNEAKVEFRSPLFVELDFTVNHETSSSCGDDRDNDFLRENCTNENSEYPEDNFDDVVITSFVLDGVDMTDSVETTDDQTFLISLENVGFGDHTAEVQAMDQAGNILEDVLEIDFEVNERDPFEKRLSPGWNLVSLPGEPADSSIASVLGPDVVVRTVYTYNPVVPGGWLVAVRETLDSEWQGDLTEITGQRGYWILSDAIQDWEVSIPRLAGGAVGTGTPIQPPVIALYAGWNLIPVTDVKGNALDAGTALDAAVYLQSLEDGIEAARVLGFDTIRNEWYTVLDGDMMSPGMGTNLLIGSGYWVFVRNATALVPGGVPGVGGSD